MTEPVPPSSAHPTAAAARTGEDGPGATGVSNLPSHPLPTETAGVHKPFYQQLYFWVLLGVFLGAVVGYLRPEFGKSLKPLGDGFIALIKMLIAPIIFCTVVGGIASVGDLKKVGRVGVKALLYFELVTTLAMLIALGTVHLVRPGDYYQKSRETASFQVSDNDKKKVAAYQESAKKQSTQEFILHIIPTTVVSAFTEGEILQVLLVSVLLGVALAKMGERAKPLTRAIQLGAQAFFNVVGFVVRLAPIAAFGAMAYTVGDAGLSALRALGMMMLCFYATCVLFIFVVLGTIAYLNGFNIFKYLRYIKEEILLVLGTSSSESALPPMMSKMERIGCAESVVGVVLPAGYSFNLDGTSIYLAMAIVFISQATNTALTMGEELGLLGLLLLTSKGAAAVTGGGFITLAATLQATSHGAQLVGGLPILVGIDRFMSEARAITNLIGNGLATILVAKSEREFDYAKAGPILLAGHPELLPTGARPAMAAAGATSYEQP